MSNTPFNLSKPTSTYYHGRICWSPSLEHMVEYNLWKFGGPIMVGELQARICTHFHTDLSASYLGQIMRSLCGQGKARKLARGLYVHWQVEVKAPAPPAPTLEDLLS